MSRSGAILREVGTTNRTAIDDYRAAIDERTRIDGGAESAGDGEGFQRPHSVMVTPLREDIAGKTQTTLVVLLCASAALLLIACVNLANLLMSRGAARGREGAGRGRLAAQFLTESLVLAGLGSVARLALAVPAMRFLETLVPETMGTVRLTLDWRVLAYSTILTIASVLTFGLARALRGSRLAPQDGLRGRARGTAGVRSYWFQHSIIVIETALAVVLLTSGGLLLQTFQNLRNTDFGMRSEKLLTLRLHCSAIRTSTGAWPSSTRSWSKSAQFQA